MGRESILAPQRRAAREPNSYHFFFIRIMKFIRANAGMFVRQCSVRAAVLWWSGVNQHTYTNTFSFWTISSRTVDSMLSWWNGRIRNLRGAYMANSAIGGWKFFPPFSVLRILAVSLYTCSEKHLPQWPLRISINSLLSLYAFIFRSTP
jgi:hypothetical protein